MNPYKYKSHPFIYFYYSYYSDSEMPKTGLLKAFSSKEKDVINVLDNMRTKTMRLRNRSSQKTDQEGIN